MEAKIINMLFGMDININTDFKTITISDNNHILRHPDTLLNLFIELKKLQKE